jgi:radical SAM protein with 4Fe4S-binding SPASM domain
MVLTWGYRGARKLRNLGKRGIQALAALLPPGRLAAQKALVARLYRETLGREPEREKLLYWAARLHDGVATTDGLRGELGNSREYDEIVQPVVAEIKAAYERVAFREPTSTEVAAHLSRFRRELPSAEACARAIQAGNVRTYLGFRPLSLEMDVTNQCNLRCVMCHFSDPRVYKRRRKDLSVEDFTRIARQVFPLCSRVSLSFGCEPLLHHRFGELLAVTRSFRVPFVHVTTNGTLLTEPLAEQMIQSELHSLMISIDGATQPTYERIRTGARFDGLIANIRSVNRLKARLRSAVPFLSFMFVMMRSNIEELPALVRLAHDLRVGAMTAVHMVPYDNTTTRPESLVHHKALCNRMLDEARVVAKKLRVQVCFPEKFGNTPVTGLVPAPRWFHEIPIADATRSACQFPWHWVGIDPNGCVNPCGWWYGEQPMGNIGSEPFEDIWSAERYRALRAEHRCGALRPTCLNCPAAGLGSVNNPNAFLTRPSVGPAFLDNSLDAS